MNEGARRRFVRHALAGMAIGFTLASARAVNRERIDALFRPFIAEQVTLAPDGRHVAYTEHAHQELAIIIMALEAPYAKVRILVADDKGLTFSKEKPPAQLRFLQWGAANRLVFAPAEEKIEMPIPPPMPGVPPPSGPKYLAPIMAVDADGKNPRTLIDGSDYLATILNQQYLDFIARPKPPGPDFEYQGIEPTMQRTRASKIAGLLRPAGEFVVVQALGYQYTPEVIVPTTAYKVSVRSGKKTSLGDVFFLGQLCSDQQGQFRLSYIRPLHELVRSFDLLGSGAIKLDESTFGPLGAGFTITPGNYFGHRAYPLDFDLDPNVMLVASNLGRDTFGVYAINLKTRERTDLALEDPRADLVGLEPDFPNPQLVFDESTGKLAGVRSPSPRSIAVWHDPEIADTQQGLERTFPGRTVEVLEWSAKRDVFLLRVTGGTEPGRYFALQKTEKRLLEIRRSAPWLAAETLCTTEPFEFDPPGGAHLTGYVTLPKQSRLNPPPAIVCFADGFPPTPHAEFSREAQVLASMGLIVIRLNHRGVSGFGLKHRDAILAGIDRVPVEDALAAVDWIARRHPIDRKRVATLGNGFGGYLAVRALQLHPDAFRCAVAFNAPLDPAFWLRPPGTAPNFNQEVIRTFLERGPADLNALSVLAKPETLTNPVCLILDPMRDNAIEIANLRLRDQVRRQGGVAEYLEVQPDYAAGLPDARTRTYDQLEEFFNLNLYDYKVKIGPTKEIK